MNPIDRKSKYFIPPNKIRTETNTTSYGVFSLVLMAAITALSKGRKIPFTSSYKQVKIPSFLHLIFPTRTSNFRWNGSYNPKISKALQTLSALLLLPSHKTEMERSEITLSTLPKNHPLRKEVTARILGHQADFLIGGTSLEGSNLKDNAAHLHTFIKLCSEKGTLSPQTLEKLEGFFTSLQFIPPEQSKEEREALAQAIADKVLSLKPGKSLPLQGGWTQKEENGSFSGHALLYTFAKRQDQLYDIYIYNTGSGTEKYHAKKVVQEGIKLNTLICPYVKFQGVSAASLGFSDNKAYPEFFERLLHIQQGHRRDHYKDSAIIYESRDGFGGLHHKLAIAGLNTPYSKPQRSGTCAYRVLLAAIRPLFASDEEYKRFKFEISYTDLLLFYEKSQNSLQDSSTERELLEKQGQKLLRSLEKKLDIFSKEEIAERQANISIILERILFFPKIEPLIQKIQISQVVTSRQPSTSITSYPILEPNSAYKEQINIPASILLQEVSIKNLMAYSEILRPLAKNAVYAPAVEKLARALIHFSKEDYAEISNEDAKELIIQLRDILRDYETTLITSSSYFINSQEHINTTWALLATAYTLTCKGLPALKNEGLAYSQLIRQDRFCPVYSPKEQENTVKNILFFKNQKKEDPLFNFSKIRIIEKNKPYPPEVYFLAKIFYPNNKSSISLHTAQILFCDDPTHPYREESTPHPILALRDIAFMAQVSCSTIDLDEFNNRTSHFSYRYHPQRSPISYGQNRFTVSNGVVQSWKKLGWSSSTSYSHFVAKNENEALLREGPYINNIKTSSTCEKTLQCARILYHFSGNRVKLTDIDTQQAFFDLLFQPDSDLKKEPPLFLALKDPAFIKQLSQFIREGLHFFSTISDVAATLFLIRLIRRVKDIDPTFAFKGTSETLIVL